MGSVIRGIKNAFRNGVRTGSIILILGLSIGLAVVMLIALSTVDNKITAVKASIGNTITISPAGARGFEGGGEPLTAASLADIKNLDHVSSISEVLTDRLQTDDTTTLKSAIDPGSLGQRTFRFNQRGGSRFGGGSVDSTTPSSPTPTVPANFSLPITVTGITDTQSLGQAVSGSTPTLTDGSLFAADSTDNVAVVGKALATKNSLSVGSTFTAYDTEIKVVGIYDAGNDFANGNLVLPLATLQKLSDQAGQVSQATVTVSSIDHLSSATEAIQSKLGQTADVVSSQDTSANAVEPLQNIRTISLYSLIGALAAGAIIILMTMLMIVRERRREIGVLKAIGASNLSVVTQFVSEASTFTLLASVVGVAIGLILSNPVLKALASSASNGTTQTVVSGGRMGTGPMGGFAQRLGQAGELFNGRQALESLQAAAGWNILLYGLAIALLIAILGSAIPAFLTARIRPAEVLRGE